MASSQEGGGGWGRTPRTLPLVPPLVWSAHFVADLSERPKDKVVTEEAHSLFSVVFGNFSFIRDTNLYLYSSTSEAISNWVSPTRSPPGFLIGKTNTQIFSMYLVSLWLEINFNVSVSMNSN